MFLEYRRLLLNQNGYIVDSSFNWFDILLLIVFLIIIATIITVAVYHNEKKKRYDFVVETSNKLKRVRSINNTYKFYNVYPLSFKRSCKSKKEFDRLDLKDFLVECLGENPESYSELIKMANKNDELYSAYLDEFMLIMRTDSSADEHLYKNYPFYRKLETLICDKNMLHPTLELAARVTKSYNSPQGRNEYNEKAEFHQSEIMECLSKAQKSMFIRKNINYERALMTDSLRYDVLKRDKFRCTICGATAQDGVKLHVDHIFPVSKGGKTELDNLRTLCERCNRGKSAKYDYNGIN